MYGWRLYSYRTLIEAAQTIICLQLGIFNYDEVRILAYTQLLSPNLFKNLYCSWCHFLLHTGFGLQSSSGCFPHRILHYLYDIRSAQPLYICDFGGFQRRATSSHCKSLIISESSYIFHHSKSVNWMFISFPSALWRRGDRRPDADEDLQSSWHQVQEKANWRRCFHDYSLSHILETMLVFITTW